MRCSSCLDDAQVAAASGTVTAYRRAMTQSLILRRLALALICCPGGLAAQSVDLAPSMDSAALAATPTKTFFTRRDLVNSALALAGSAVVSHFDVRLAHWAQRDAIQGGQSRHDLADVLTKINEFPGTSSIACCSA